MIRSCLRHVIIYQGHASKPKFAPYSDSIERRVQAFVHLNRNWQIESVIGENLIDKLKSKDPKETLLVIPSAQSTHLDNSFSTQELDYLYHDFFSLGGKGYLTCGAAYWASSTRIFHGVCLEQMENPKTIIKQSRLPLFEGTVEGPLCPYPGKTYKVGFKSDAVTLESDYRNCTVFISGGGSFRLNPSSNQKVRVLARYPHYELMRFGKKKEECRAWENAAILTSIGRGAALFVMSHPFYHMNTIDVHLYEKTFPNSGTNWHDVKARLSSHESRMAFLGDMINSLENPSF